VVANDRPGILASIALVLLHHDVALHNAKINTLGNRVEDSFLISASDGQPLNDTQIADLKSAFSEL
jgi:[protein-PII] uridylyltransferase